MASTGIPLFSCCTHFWQTTEHQADGRIWEARTDHHGQQLMSWPKAQPFSCPPFQDALGGNDFLIKRSFGGADKALLK
jgi:hypothetical protein